PMNMPYIRITKKSLDRRANILRKVYLRFPQWPWSREVADTNLMKYRESAATPIMDGDSTVLPMIWKPPTKKETPEKAPPLSLMEILFPPERWYKLIQTWVRMPSSAVKPTFL